MSESGEPIQKLASPPSPSPDDDIELPEDSPPPPISYSTDPIWSDVIPIPQQEGPFPVVRIAYTNVITNFHFVVLINTLWGC